MSGLILAASYLLQVGNPDPANYQQMLGSSAEVRVIHRISGDGPTHIFFSVAEPSDPTRVGAASANQRWFVMRDAADGSAESVRWASADDCPAIYSLLDWVEGVDVPEITTGVRQLPSLHYNLGDEPRPEFSWDSPSHTIEGRGRGPDFDFPWVTTTSVGGYVARWGRAVVQHLEPCWREERPDF